MTSDDVQSGELIQANKFFMDEQPEQGEPSEIFNNLGKKPLVASFVVGEDDPLKISSDPDALPHKSDGVINNDTSNSSTHNISTGETIATSTRDTIVVMITLTVILFTLIATYFLWRKRRRSFVNANSKLEEYRYSRLSQNDVEVDNITFQGDLTRKPLSNTVPVCADDDGEDDGMKPATLCLEYDSLVTLSKEGKREPPRISRSSTKPDTTSTVNALIDDFSDEQDLLQ